MKIVEPFNEEQKKYYSKISRSVNKCCMTVKESLKMMEKEEKKEKIMEKEHEENRALVILIKEMNAENDLVHLAKETEKLSNLCDCHRDYDAMNNRLTHMLNDELKPAGEAMDQEKEELTEFIIDVKAAMKKAFENYILLVRKLAATNATRINE
jgi:hypothetical protein